MKMLVDYGDRMEPWISIQDDEPFMSCSCTLEDYLATFNTCFEQGRCCGDGHILPSSAHLEICNPTDFPGNPCAKGQPDS